MEMRRKAAELDGTDLRAKRRRPSTRRTAGRRRRRRDRGRGGRISGAIRVRRPDAIVRGLGCVGFVVTCSFQREKSATRRRRDAQAEAADHQGLRLNPVNAAEGSSASGCRRYDPDASDAKPRRSASGAERRRQDGARRGGGRRRLTRTVADVKAGRAGAAIAWRRSRGGGVRVRPSRHRRRAVAALAASGFDEAPRVLRGVVPQRFKRRGSRRARRGGREAARRRRGGRHGRREVIEAVAGGVRRAHRRGRDGVGGPGTRTWWRSRR